MNVKEQYSKELAETIIKNLKKRQIEGHYCKTSKDAVTLACSMLQKDAVVSYGGSMTLTETGLLPLLREKEGITLLDRDMAASQSEAEQIYRQSFLSDTYFMSTNAITIEGELVNIDGRGNRVAALIYGPSQVVILAGMNKVASNLEDACHRVKDVASPQNNIRLETKNPCTTAGHCKNCFGTGSICSQTVITRRSSIPDRIKVILIGEVLGY